MAWRRLADTPGAIGEARKKRSSFLDVAASWWYLRLRMFEFRHQLGVIAHPRDIGWGSWYVDQFIPEMRARGIPWIYPSEAEDLKVAALKVDGQTSSSDSEVDGDDDISSLGGLKGSASTWRRGRQRALVQHSREKLDDCSQVFRLISREKHSAYKECHKCQTKRLAIEDAVKRRLGQRIILRLE